MPRLSKGMPYGSQQALNAARQGGMRSAPGAMDAWKAHGSPSITQDQQWGHTAPAGISSDPRFGRSIGPVNAPGAPAGISADPRFTAAMAGQGAIKPAPLPGMALPSMAPGAVMPPHSVGDTGFHPGGGALAVPGMAPSGAVLAAAMNPPGGFSAPVPISAVPQFTAGMSANPMPPPVPAPAPAPNSYGGAAPLRAPLRRF